MPRYHSVRIYCLLSLLQISVFASGISSAAEGSAAFDSHDVPDVKSVPDVDTDTGSDRPLHKLKDAKEPDGEQTKADVAPTRHTLQQLRFKNVVKQDSDYSCGAATLATLMTYHFGEVTTESDVMEAMIENLSEEEQRGREYAGFSLLDMKMAANEFGYTAAGYRLTIEQLRQLTAPVIVHVVPLDYKHFAVLRTIVGDRVVLADPSRGNLRMSVSRFEDEWSGIVFVMSKSGESVNGTSSLKSLENRDKLPDKLRWFRQVERAFQGNKLSVDW